MSNTLDTISSFLAHSCGFNTNLACITLRTTTINHNIIKSIHKTTQKFCIYLSKSHEIWRWNGQYSPTSFWLQRWFADGTKVNFAHGPGKPRFQRRRSSPMSYLDLSDVTMTSSSIWFLWNLNTCYRLLKIEGGGLRSEPIQFEDNTVWE